MRPFLYVLLVALIGLAGFLVYRTVHQAQKQGELTRHTLIPFGVNLLLLGLFNNPNIRPDSLVAFMPFGVGLVYTMLIISYSVLYFWPRQTQPALIIPTRPIYPYKFFGGSWVILLVGYPVFYYFGYLTPADGWYFLFCLGANLLYLPMQTVRYLTLDKEVFDYFDGIIYWAEIYKIEVENSGKEAIFLKVFRHQDTDKPFLTEKLTLEHYGELEKWIKTYFPHLLHT